MHACVWMYACMLVNFIVYEYRSMYVNKRMYFIGLCLWVRVIQYIGYLYYCMIGLYIRSCDADHLYKYDFTCIQGYLVGIMGPVSSGKTSLVRAILGQVGYSECQLGLMHMYYSLLSFEGNNHTIFCIGFYANILDSSDQLN